MTTFTHAGALPPLPSRPRRPRPFAYAGDGLAAGVLTLEADRFRLEWDQADRVWLLAKETGDGAVYAVRAGACTCPGFAYHRKCRHLEVLTELAKEHRRQKEYKKSLTGESERCRV